MKLEQIVPRETSFKLRTTKNTYKLRKFSLSDEIWLKEHFADRILEVFNPECPDFDAICRIIYHQIINREDFAVKNVKIIDENGEESVEYLGGYKLLSAMVFDADEKVLLINSINTVMGYSRPRLMLIPKKKLFGTELV